MNKAGPCSPLIEVRQGAQGSVGSVVPDLRRPGGGPPGPWAARLWRGRSGHRSHSRTGPQTPSARTLPGPWPLQSREILSGETEETWVYFAACQHVALCTCLRQPWF